MRALKWVGIGLLVLGLIAGFVFYRIRSRMKGPEPPVCSEEALAGEGRRTIARGAFGPPIQISGPKSPGARLYDIEPMAALLPDGALAIVYNTRDSIIRGTSGLSTAVVGLDGQVDIQTYPTDRKEAFDAWLAASPDGKLRMVWLAHDGGRPEKNMKVGYAESTDGVSWTDPGAAHSPADCPDNARGCMDKPMIAVGHGAMYSIYYSEPGGGLRVARRRLELPDFEASVKAGNGAYGDVELAQSGKLHLVFVSARDSKDSSPDRFGDLRNAVFHTRSDDGGRTFSAPAPVSTTRQAVPFFFSNPQVRADEDRGFLYVVYPSGPADGRWNIILAASRDQGQTWTQVRVNDDPPCANHMTPRAALDPRTGILHVTWLENRSGRGALAYAACQPGGARCGPNEQVSETPFASYTFERHLPAWLAEYGALVVDPERSTLHAVWTQPVKENGEAISRIFHARAKLAAPEVPLSPPSEPREPTEPELKP